NTTTTSCAVRRLHRGIDQLRVVRDVDGAAPRRRRLVWVTASLAVLALLPLPGTRHGTAYAACNVLPQQRTTFRSTLGSVSTPFASPGDWVELQLFPACDGASSGFSGTTADQVVTLVFTPPEGPRNVVVIAEDCNVREAKRQACEARNDVASAVC